MLVVFMGLVILRKLRQVRVDLKHRWCEKCS